jgi:hypothetical protein
MGGSGDRGAGASVETIRQVSAGGHQSRREMPSLSIQSFNVACRNPRCLRRQAAGRSHRRYVPGTTGAQAYLAMTPLRPLEVSEAMLARMRGSASPLEEARYFGSHSGSNFSLN